MMQPILPVFLSVVLVALGSILPSVAISKEASENENGPFEHLDKYNGITVTVAAGAALAADQYRYRRSLDALHAVQSHSTTVVKGTGATLLNRSSDKIVDLILSDTRHGDVVSIDYTPGTIDELKHTVQGLKDSELAWERRVDVLSKELKAIERRKTVARHQLAELPLKEESREARERAQTRLAAAEREFAFVKQAELDAQARMHHARGLYAAERLNLESSIKGAEADAARGRAINPKVITTVVRIDYPVDETTRKQLLTFVDHVTSSKLPREAKQQMPRVKITRVNMPDLKGSLKLLKDARRGVWGVGLAAMVAVEEVTTGYLADGLRESLAPASAVSPQNSRTSR